MDVMDLFFPWLSFPTVCTYRYIYLHVHAQSQAHMFYYQSKQLFLTGFLLLFSGRNNSATSLACSDPFICVLYRLLPLYKNVHCFTRHKIQIISVMKSAQSKQNGQHRQDSLRSPEEWRLVLFLFYKYIANIIRQERDMFSSSFPFILPFNSTFLSFVQQSYDATWNKAWFSLLAPIQQPWIPCLLPSTHVLKISLDWCLRSRSLLTAALSLTNETISKSIRKEPYFPHLFNAMAVGYCKICEQADVYERKQQEK